MLSLCGILLFFLIWEALVMFKIVDSKKLCDVLDVFRLFIVKMTDPNPDGAVLPVNIWSSLQIALTGFGLAIVIGIPLGWLMGWYRGFDAFMRPIFEIIRPIPPVSWIPLTIVWMGIGLKAKAFIVFFAAFVPCLINSYTGIRQTKEVLINVCKTFGATNFRTFLTVGIPSSMTMTDAENQEYVAMYTDIETLANENTVKFITGEKDLSEWDDFVAQLKQYGIERCIELQQAALDRYNKR